MATLKNGEGGQDDQRSLGEVHESVDVPSGGSFLRRWLAIAGPALMVAVGYMDPGNWATDLAGGSRYEYKLIWVLLMSNLMAVLLQSLAARLGIARRRDLAQASRESYPRFVNIPLYILAEIAITATDLAEVIGSAIAFKLLFGIPLLWGVLITSFDVLFLLVLSRFGIRKLEALVLAFVGTIGVAFLVELFLAEPDWGGLIRGFSPSMPDSSALYIAIGILGATVMPHNLYLHSSLVQTRRTGRSLGDLKKAIGLNTLDSAISLNIAFLINASILVVAAAVFFRTGHHEVAEIQDAHHLLEPILGAAIAPIAFAVALLASGQSSTITGTLAGQIVMEGYLNFRIRPWLRRMITRLLAVVPAAATILYFGEDSTARLLVLSQVMLSLQLPFAIIPLIHFVSDREQMGELAIKTPTKIMAWLVAAIIVVLNVKLVIDEVTVWFSQAGSSSWVLVMTVIPVAMASAFLLLYVTLRPMILRARSAQRKRASAWLHSATDGDELQLGAPESYRHVAVALDLNGNEQRLINESLRFLPKKGGATITLVHVVESPVAHAMGESARDLETEADESRLEQLCAALNRAGYPAQWRLGLGAPVTELSRLIGEIGADLVLLGAHGHKGLADLVHGTTVESLRHRVSSTVVIVPLAAEQS